MGRVLGNAAVYPLYVKEVAWGYNISRLKGRRPWKSKIKRMDRRPWKSKIKRMEREMEEHMRMETKCENL